MALIIAESSEKSGDSGNRREAGLASPIFFVRTTGAEGGCEVKIFSLVIMSSLVYSTQCGLPSLPPSFLDSQFLSPSLSFPPDLFFNV